jgi:hypothetical protein
VAIGVGYAARAGSSSGFGAVGARVADARTRCCRDFLLVRRLDDVEVIGRTLVLAIVIGQGMRTVADRMGVPMTTARDWRRRFRVRAAALTVALVAIAVQLDPAAVLLKVDGEPAAIEALGAVWQRANRRFGERIPRMWRFWSLINGGQALGTNRSPPATQRIGAGWMGPSL